jgi:hypothetical protein
MSFKKFGDSDVMRNTMRAYPNSDFLIYDGNVYYNQRPDQVGHRNTRARNVENGFISLYELNIDRPEVATGRYIGPSAVPEGGEPDTRIADTARIYPYISKDSAGASFKTVGATTYNNEFSAGDILTGKYPFSASITREYIPTPYASTTSYNTSYVAIRNALNHNNIRSEHYAVSSPGNWNKNTQVLNMINVPSIFYGSKIKPGSVRLEWYYTGSLLAVVSDLNQNGELIQFSSSYNTAYDNKVAGVVLYDEGIILLTGSWALNSSTMNFSSTVTGQNPKWIHFGAGANDGNSHAGASAGATFGKGSYKLSFKGITETQVLTMFAKAKKGEVNYSNNPSFLQYNQQKIFNTSSNVYQEKSDLQLVNFVSSSYTDYNAPFKRQVYISRIGIYDKNRNLIGIATMGSPVLKQDDQELAFKLKIDI